MTRPDPDSPDPGANQDDAVWLDLVARLEGKDPDAPGDGSGEGSPAGKAFRDFDPLGLSVAAPVERSAQERLAPKTPADGAGNGPDTAPGPRDHEADDDEGAFVPEEPPSLAGADPMTVLAWLGAVGGPVALVLAAMFWRSAPLVAILGIVATFAASVIFLIMKLPGEKDEHDDGARV
jgi:hypothetical protein